MSVATRRETEGHHAVCTYTDVDRLAAEVAHHLHQALTAGGSAIAVATAAHRRAFERELWALGCPQVVTGERLIMLDAAKLLERFMVGDRPDAAAFDASVGELVRAADATGGPVHVYGEMVALLWDRGLIAGAIELEELWNDLGRCTTFALLCAYPQASVGHDRHAEAYAHVCRLHTSVTDLSSRGSADVVAEVARTFACELTAPSDARSFVSATLARWGWRDRADDVVLVVSELTTNAVLHARSEFVLRLTSWADRLRVAVTDDDPTPPAPRAPAASSPSGRGLLLIAAITDAWGTDVGASGKTVWAELAH